ncbi:hypothetical protein TNCV_2201331 [Trichonephila clavipes]|uniref:Uncharacterized protein n=1 Tax=Trichonephila clavipes TaxID=2585209 RepID=A0A8X6SGZ6_TRICX|nr:hypothetical protein TNCV_2201331 [Trichonephila clavipes]
MHRFGGLSEERPSVFKTLSKLGTHSSTQCSGDERQSRPSVFKTLSKLGTHSSTQCSGDVRQSRPCAAYYRTPDLWCESTKNYQSIIFGEK